MHANPTRADIQDVGVWLLASMVECENMLGFTSVLTAREYRDGTREVLSSMPTCPGVSAETLEQARAVLSKLGGSPGSSGPGGLFGWLKSVWN